MHKLILILLVLLYVDDVYFWVNKRDDVSTTDYTVFQEAKMDSVTYPTKRNEKIEKIDIINAQDTTITIVVHRN